LGGESVDIELEVWWRPSRKWAGRWLASERTKDKESGARSGRLAEGEMCC
jgi:hypothetical protein